MALVTSQPVVLTDGASSPVTHTYTYHHQSISEPLSAVYFADTSTDAQPRSLNIKHAEKKGRVRSLAQITLTENVGTEAAPVWSPVTYNFTVSRSKSGSSAVAAAGIAEVADLLGTAGFAAGFIGKYIS